MYSPNSTSLYSASSSGSTVLTAAVWLAAIAIWCAASWRLFRSVTAPPLASTNLWGSMPNTSFHVSAAERFDEDLSIDTRLPENAAQRPSLDLTMGWHHAAGGPTTHHHMAPTLTYDHEPEMLQRSDDFRPRDVRKFRQRRRCGTW